MTDTIRNASDQDMRYIAPQVKVIEVKVRGVLCISDGNETMREFDYGNGGFGEE